MQINVKLYSILREKLPPENNGEVILDMAEDSSVQDLLKELDINYHVVISINDNHQPNFHHTLKDRDHVRIFTIIGGGTQ